MSPKVEALVRHILRSFASDVPDRSPEVDDLPEFYTQEEADEVHAEVERRIRAAFGRLRARIVERLPNATEADLAVIDRELQNALAPLGKRFDLN